MAAKGEMVIRDIVDVEEMRAVEELQKEVWGLSDRDVASVFMLAATNAVGGVLVGAFDGDRLVGFAYGFVGLEAGRTILHSDMLAVLPAHRGRDVGFRLKLAQRERALARGLRVMTWTFDPLQSRNARLNFGKLGVLSDRYFVNFYGEQTSSFLHTTGTDRLWVSWLLDSPRVRGRAAGRASDEGSALPFESPALVRVGRGDSPESSGGAEALKGGRVLVEIPADIGALQKQNPSLAVEWRLATRHAFTSALDAGYVVEEFFRVERDGRGAGVYVMSAGKTLEDFAA